MPLLPPADRVLCQLLPAETHTHFGLELPEQAREQPLRAIVLAVGAGAIDANGERIPLGLHFDSPGVLLTVQPNMEVILPRVGGTEIETDDGETVISILASELLAVLA